MEIEVGEILFLDTNVLLIATDESRPHHEDARRIFEISGQSGYHFGINGQVVREYLVVATRPVDINGLGLGAGEAMDNLDALSKHAVFYEETESVATRLRELVRSRSITGTRIHDVNVVATMLAHALSKLITQNPGDFSPFEEIETVGVADAARLIQ